MNCTAVRDRSPSGLWSRLPATTRHGGGSAPRVVRRLPQGGGRARPRAAATLAFSLAPAAARRRELEDRVVAAVQRSPPPERGLPRRRGRLAVAAAVAAMLAVVGPRLGRRDGGRAARFEDQATVQRPEATGRVRPAFRQILNGSEFNDPANEVFMGRSRSRRAGGTAAGRAHAASRPAHRHGGRHGQRVRPPATEDALPFRSPAPPIWRQG